MNEAITPLRWEIQPIADQAVNIDFGELIEEHINQRVTSLAAQIKQQQIFGVTGCIPTYRSLTINYDSVKIKQQELISLLEHLLTDNYVASLAHKCWHIPVCYGGEQGIDLTTCAETLGLTSQALINIHSSPTYRIYMIGFMPGFAYLGGMDERLHIPRRISPRQQVPSGSISIGGVQSAIGSVAAPSGWHLLGRTPVKSFDAQREEPFLFNAGEEVKFFSISVSDYHEILAKKGYLPEWSMLP